MMTDNEDITQPVETGTQENNLKPKRRLGVGIWLGLGLVLILTVIGGLLGYSTALQARLQQEANQRALLTTTQFQLGIIDAEAGRYDMARQRFEYVLKLDPNFPGALDQLAQVSVKMAMVQTPTPAPSPTAEFTPTPDLTGVADIFNLATEQIRASQWQAALDTLDNVRSEKLDYKPIEVDGYYYMALRYRGIEKILQDGDLEGGIYLLALAEQYAPLDKDADSFREWARYYLSGASYWGVNWEKVLYYFAQIYPSFPNLRDTSGITAIERFRRGSIGYGNQLAAAGEYCRAMEQYNNAFNLGIDEAIAPTATEVMNLCYGPTNTPKPEVVNTPTPTIGVIVETPTPTVEVVVPTETPTVAVPPASTP